jgi:hypothetical protein
MAPDGKLGQRETRGGSPRVTPIARHYTSGEQVCPARVAVGLHRRIALAPGSRTNAPFRVFALTESER